MKLKGLYQNGEYWYYQAPQVHGIRPKPVSLGTKDYIEAIQQYESLIRRDFSERRPGAIKIEAERYLKDRLDRHLHTPQTSRDTGYTLNRLAKFVGQSKIVGAITTADLQNWVSDLQKTNNSTSIRSTLNAVSGFFTWAEKAGISGPNPVKSLELAKSVATRAENYCTREERDRIIAAVPDDRDDLGLILYLGFYAGMRIGEIIETRRGWVDLHGHVITVRNTDTFTAKGKRSRKIRISPVLHAYLTNYLETWTGTDAASYLLRPDKAPGRKRKNQKYRANRWRYDPTRPFKALTKSAGLEWVGFHSMRHSFGTLHAMANTPLATIAREMGDDYRTTYNNYIGYTRHNDHSGAID